VGVLVVGLAAAGCSKTTNDSSGGKDTKAEKQVINLDTEGKAPVPAPEVPGAKKGGTITWLQEGAPEHLDPGQIYVSDALDVSTHLLFRTLTAYIEPSKEGDPLQLVGDLATNAGETKDGGKTWTYHLRAGTKFEDGTAITSKDIAYGIARSCTKYGA